jgi:hypothetical protein
MIIIKYNLLTFYKINFNILVKNKIDNNKIFFELNFDLNNNINIID